MYCTARDVKLGKKCSKFWWDCYSPVMAFATIIDNTVRASVLYYLCYYQRTCVAHKLCNVMCFFLTCKLLLPTYVHVHVFMHEKQKKKNETHLEARAW